MVGNALRPFLLILAIGLATTAPALFGVRQALAVPPHAWMATNTHAHPTNGAVFKRYLDPTETLNIAVVLRLRNADTLRQHLSRLTTPGSTEFRHWLTRDRILSDYAPGQDQAKAAAAYLSRAGFTNVRIAANRLLVTATGTAAAIRNAFHTELGRFVLNGREVIANTQDVQVPASLGGIVLSVLGLQTVDQMHPLSVPANRILTTGTVHGLNPISFPIVYDVASLPAAASANVGIVSEGDLTQTLADLQQFDSQNNLPAITTMEVGTPSSDTSGTAEWDLDSQIIQAMAGGRVGTLIFYLAASLRDSDVFAALNTIVNDNAVPVVNISLGECERTAKIDGAMAADDQLFQLAIAQGQTISVASGDQGSKECIRLQQPETGASYPASSPYVIAVGGTSLSTDNNGNYAGETAWSGSGGSPSLYEGQPGWQGGVVTGSFRGIPDIAFDADPTSGAIIVVNGQNQQWGGTSLASPLFVGAWIRIQTANNARLGFPASWIYSHGSQRTNAYHDVTSGSNGDYSAAAGWDYTTGWGSLDVVATALLTQSSVTVSVSPSTITAGMAATLTATVTGNLPSGTVQFLVNGVDFGSPVALVNGVATLTTTQLPGGVNAITAAYSGDFNDAGSTSSASFTETVTTTAGATVIPSVPVWGEWLLALALIALGIDGNTGRRSQTRLRSAAHAPSPRSQ